MSMRPHIPQALRPQALRLRTYLLFILSLSLQANLGYAASGCSMSGPGTAVCHTGSSPDVRFQNPCCCPEISSCYAVATVAPIPVAEVTVTKWDAPAPSTQALNNQGRTERLQISHPRFALDIKKPPLHILKSALLI
jgi:hypothetical protein